MGNERHIARSDDPATGLLDEAGFNLAGHLQEQVVGGAKRHGIA